MALEYRRVRQFFFTIFPAPLLRLGVIPTPGRPGEAIPTGYAEIPTRWPGTIGAINGPMASYGANDPHDYDRWTSSRLDSAYYQVEGGIDVPPRRPAMGLTVGVRIGTPPPGQIGGPLEAYAARGWSRDARTRVAVQLPFGLVSAGRVGDGLERGNLASTTARALLGITRDGRLIFGGGVGSCAACAAAAVEAGCLVGGYLDGGCSYNQEYAADHLHGSRCDRRTPSHILIAPDGSTPALVPLVPLACNTNTCRPLNGGSSQSPGRVPATTNPAPSPAPSSPEAPPSLLVPGLLVTGVVLATAYALWHEHRQASASRAPSAPSRGVAASGRRRRRRDASRAA
jgi:hypothetical protein